MKSEMEAPFPRPLSGAVVDKVPPALVPARAPIKGRLITLEPQNADKHTDELYQAGHNTKQALAIWDYMAYGPWPDPDNYKQTLRAQSSSFDPIFFTLVDNASGTACGQASFLDINAQNGVIEIGHIWFSPKLQRTAAGTEALYLMLCLAMDDLGYRRMQWRCNSLNEKSRGAARRLGFRFEGIFYNHLIFKGKNRDTAWYSILDNEWPEVRNIIEQWLQPSNFSTEGVPKTSLTELMTSRKPGTRSV